MEAFIPKTEEDFFKWNEEMAVKYNPDTYHTSSNWIVRWIERCRVDRIFDFLDVRSEHSVLEVGVGAGNILARVMARQRWGLDLSPTLLAIAKERLPDAKLMLGNAEQFPAELHELIFDRVYCSEVLEHVQKPESVIKEIALVLAPDGIAVVSVPNERYINVIKKFLQKIHVFKLLFPKLSAKMDDEWHLHVFDKKTLHETVGNSFVIEKMEAVPYSWFPIRLVAKLLKRERVVES